MRRQYRDERGRFRGPREGEYGYVRPIDPLLVAVAEEWCRHQWIAREHDARADFEALTRGEVGKK